MQTESKCPARCITEEVVWNEIYLEAQPGCSSVVTDWAEGNSHACPHFVSICTIKKYFLQNVRRSCLYGKYFHSLYI
jgi:hypothetical protein